MDEFIHRMREKLSLESENRQYKLIQSSIDRLKRFMTPICLKYIHSRLENKEQLNQYTLRNWKEKGGKK